MKTRALTDVEKGEVVGMYKGGMRGTQITRELRMSSSTVYGVLRSFKKQRELKMSFSTVYGVLRSFKKQETIVLPKSSGRPQTVQYLEEMLHDFLKFSKNLY